MEDNENVVVLGETLTIEEYIERERVYKAAIEAVRDLMNESVGVVGLHLNGDVASWEDLTEGCDSDWLEVFLEAEEVANNDK